MRGMRRARTDLPGARRVTGSAQAPRAGGLTNISPPPKPRNLLKSNDSDERIQGNPNQFDRASATDPGLIPGHFRNSKFCASPGLPGVPLSPRRRARKFSRLIAYNLLIFHNPARFAAENGGKRRRQIGASQDETERKVPPSGLYGRDGRLGDWLRLHTDFQAMDRRFWTPSSIPVYVG
jgi:hypothetical protein